MKNYLKLDMLLDTRYWKLNFMQEIKNLYHLFQATLANFYYGFPSRKIKVIGVTGTDGKTTTTQCIYHILSSAGKKVSMISTVYAKIGNKTYDIGLHTTTPDPFMVQRFIRRAVDDGDEYFVLETTSHAIDQYRVFGVEYTYAVVTNITHEHLDYHQTYEKYVNTKAKLLKRSRFSFINADDRSYSRLKSILNNHTHCYAYGFSHGIDFTHDMKGMASGFNAYNYLAAYSVTTQIGLPEKIICKALKTFKLPAGRMELVHDNRFKVVIDFAHTPNAFENVLPELREEYTENGERLIHVFGSAGLRDHTKRPLMGAASNKHADVIILTEEDYRTEDPIAIAKQIAQGITNKPYEIIVDRQKAIDKAISLAKANDVVVITGKSHEKSLCRGKEEYPWDDKAAVMSALKKYHYL